MTLFNESAEKNKRLLDELAKITSSPDLWPNWKWLESTFPRATPSEISSEMKKGRDSKWHGKSFVSKDGFTIWVGRNKQENLELTFKCARGNDLWLHLRGRPGAHTIIPLPGGKSAPLETLLDAAALTIYYSGGEKWGKTEVDYTFKKHVKRIKDSTEASYTHNKTLIVEPDPERIRRLIQQNA
jgi:predicted ribosome quality control (RQC) complex YloA/Tae2 family protein